jgi:isopentenyl-diphosphate delta-isomerase
MVTSSKTDAKPKTSSTEKRKLDHIRICLEKNVQSSVPTGFDDIRFIHSAAPELNLEDIDLQCIFLGHQLQAPLIITAMTGGHPEATPINQHIAEAIENLGLAMGVGSQRAAIEDQSLIRSFSIVRQAAPSAFIIGNIGAPQLSLGYSLKQLKIAIEMLKANAIAIHFNAAQEAVQPEGEASFQNVLSVFKTLASNAAVPLIAKETGAGLSREAAMALAKAGAKALDVAGLGGTSWPAVEVERAKQEDSRKAMLGRLFSDWGIPTAVATFEVAATTNLPIITSGGMRSGLDVAKAIAMGGTIGGLALPALAPATISTKAVQEFLEGLIHGLKATMFLVGASNITELAKAPLVVSGATRNWLELRGYDVKALANRQIPS